MIRFLKIMLNRHEQ